MFVFARTGHDITEVTVDGYVSMMGTVVTLPGWTYDRTGYNTPRVFDITDLQLTCDGCTANPATHATVADTVPVCWNCAPYYGTSMRRITADDIRETIDAYALSMACEVATVSPDTSGERTYLEY